MVITMQKESNLKDGIESPDNFNLSSISNQQIISLIIGPDSEEFKQTDLRQELISRGKDNIEQRIAIKKLCKAVISDLESEIKKLDTLENYDKNKLKDYKNRFLTSISLLDKLQLEWQKHDLMLKRL